MSIPKPGDVLSIDLDLLDDNPFQPRAEIDDAKLQELIAAIKKSGLLQPISVRPFGAGRYQIVAGHRRVAAFKYLRSSAPNETGRREWALIRAHVVGAIGDEQMAVSAYVENAARENLNPVEEAAALAKIKELGAHGTAKEVAEAVGQNDQRVRRLLRLDAAPAAVKLAVTTGVLVARGANDDRRERRRLDLLGALEFARLNEHYESKKPKDAAARTQAAVERALSEGWGLRRIQEHVDGAIKGREAVATTERCKLPLFEDTTRRLVVNKDQVAAATVEVLEELDRALTAAREQVAAARASLAGNQH